MQRVKWCTILITVLFSLQTFVFAKLLGQDRIIQVVSVGHSHNDYLRNQPLYDALNNGFASVEVDLFYRDGAFLVAHTFLGIRKRKNLKSLYLEPLQQWIEESGGSVYPGWDGQFILMLDLKGDWDRTALRQLEQELLSYSTIFSATSADSKVHQPVRVLISGGYSLEWFADDDDSIFSVDGRFSNMHLPIDSAVMPRVSANFRTYFSWRGKGEMSEEERELLRQLVDSVHAHNRKIRFWGVPDFETVWRELLDAGIDWINTDRPSEFTRYFHKYCHQKGE